MNRHDLLQNLLPELENALVVCNIGAPSQELYALADRAENFYMLGTMGLASSIGLGLALSQPKKVVAIDGDGSVLTNLATLATIANTPTENFVLLIVDNGSYGSTGDQPTYAGARTSLAAVAQACGCENVVEVTGADTKAALKAALNGDKMTVIVSKVDSGNAKVPVIDLNPVVMRDRFMRAVGSL